MSHGEEMTYQEKKDKFGDIKVTLDDKPAVIQGFKNDFATVATLPTGPAYEWAWATVAQIVTRDGKLKS